MIASKYSLKDARQGPIEYNAVTLSSYEVSINISDNNDWTTYFPKNPKVSCVAILTFTNFLLYIDNFLQISRTEIEIQEFYRDKFKDLLKLSYPPRIDISVTLTPVTPKPKPLELHVEGLDSECIFKLLPGITSYIQAEIVKSYFQLPNSATLTLTNLVQVLICSYIIMVHGNLKQGFCNLGH